MLEKTKYTGNELKIDGYYYYQDERGTFINFLYRNGIIMSTYKVSTYDLKYIENEIFSDELFETIKNDKTRWGLFLISGNIIQYEQWSTSVGGGLPVFKCIGNIENDTTFHITKSINSDGTQFNKNNIYHFKQFTPKPDSTNKGNYLRQYPK